MRTLALYLSGLLVIWSLCFNAQNEARKWYFGGYAGLDFNSNPPNILTNSAMLVYEGCASITDAGGNLLFYTTGSIIYDQTHNVMANGSGILGGSTPSQSSIILKKPGSINLYYVFTTQDGWNNSGAHYSIVDMSLASGQGSVTVKNAVLSTASTAEKITATRHCNGVDYWVVIKDQYYNMNNSFFRAFLLTSAGINTVAVTSPAANWWNNVNWYDVGCMKISPNGKKLGSAVYYNGNINNNQLGFELYDFDNTTGAVSNSLSLSVGSPTNNLWWGGYGCEFSPDGTKFYGARLYNGGGNYGSILQWDLCAGSPTAIVASQFAVAVQTVNVGNYFGSMQLAPNGKIYVAKWNQSSLAVINNPNASGSACNFVDNQQSLGPKVSYYGLPNFTGSLFNQPPPQPPFTHTVSNSFGCQTASFTAPPIASNFTLAACASMGFSLTGFVWNFGDPSSGANNTSTVVNPAHAFTNLGTYTTQLILYYSCGGGTDTIKQVVNVNQPCISVSSTSITCANLGSATVTALNGVGPFSYTWTPTAQTSSVANGLSPGTYTITVHDFGNNFTYTASTVFTSLIPLTGNVLHCNSVTCNGANTGTATVINLTGGSGTQNFIWTNGVVTYTPAFTNSLSAGLWSLNVTDALTGCTINDLFIVTQPPAQNPVITASSPTTCAGTSITFTAGNSGGTPGSGTAYTYTWTGGPQTNTYSATQGLAGNYSYTVSVSDSLNCKVSQTISVDYVPNPTLTVLNTSICPLETGTLSVSGASSYTWQASTPFPATGSSFTDSPMISSQYTVVGEALSCTTAATASIVLKPVPNPSFISNSPICQNSNLLFSVSTGTAFVWNGVNTFTSVSNQNTLSAAQPTQSGVYQVTVTAANSCTASVQGTLVIHPTPTLSASGSTMCITQSVNLSSNSFPGANYVWTGPNNFVSLQQNPVIANPSVAASGYYTVYVTSLPGCTNSAMAHVTVTPMPVISFTTNSPQCWGKTLLLNASATTGALSYNWTGPNSFTSTSQNPNLANVTLLASGNYSLTVSTGPCIASASHSVTINPLPVPLAFNTSPVCEGKNFQIGVNSCGVTYTWTGPNNFYNTSQNLSFSGASLNHTGNYTVKVTDANGCVNSDISSVSILQNPTVTASGDLVCFGEPAQLSALGANSYLWKGPANYTANGSNPIIAPTINTAVWTYTVTGTAVNGCTAVSTTTVGTRVLPLANLTVTPRVCVKTLVSLKGEGGLLYHWSGPLNFVSEQQNTSFIAWNVGMAGNYSLTVTDAFGCKGYTFAPVLVDPEPTGEIVGSKVFGCVPFCSTFSMQPSLPGAISNSIWEINNEKFNVDRLNYCFNTPGTFELKGHFDNQQNCKGELSKTIEVYPIPEADFSYLPLKPVENQDQVIFTNRSKGDYQYKWTWAFNDGKNQNRSTEVTDYVFEDAGFYTVVLIVENKWTCADTVIRNLEVVSDFNVYIPNAFTPNGDGLNDTFFPVMRGIKQFELNVFDRWGVLIFASNSTEHVWDGMFKGQECKQDNYSYNMNVLNIKGEEKHYTGTILLYR